MSLTRRNWLMTLSRRGGLMSLVSLMSLMSLMTQSRRGGLMSLTSDKEYVICRGWRYSCCSEEFGYLAAVIRAVIADMENDILRKGFKRNALGGIVRDYIIVMFILVTVKYPEGALVRNFIQHLKICNRMDLKHRHRAEFCIHP